MCVGFVHVCVCVFVCVCGVCGIESIIKSILSVVNSVF